MDTNYNIDLPSVPIRDPFMIRLRRKLVRTFVKPETPATAIGWPAMPYPTVELVYWRPGDGVNFGDELSRTIVELMLARKGTTVFDEVPVTRRMLAIGSVIHYASDDSVIWGSGVNGSVVEAAHTYKTLDVRSVRGPLTAKFLSKRGIFVPEIYGDPGLLIKALTGSRFGTRKTGKTGIVPHMSDLHRPEVTRLHNASGEFIIDPYRSWNVVVDEIASCDFIISSSLHGLVVADAFGIPAIYVRLGDREGLLKYEDYYAGTGRSLRFVTSMDDALADKGCEALNYDPSPLLDAFPYDIWIS